MHATAEPAAGRVESGTQTSQVAFLRCSEQDRDAILELLGNLPYKRAIWNWQFLENPHANRFDPVVLYDQEGQVLGFNGVMPVAVSYDGELVDAIWSCDFVVRQGFRDQGYGQTIKAHLKQACPLIMVLGVSDSAAAVLDKMGWHEVGGARLFQRVARLDGPKALVAGALQGLNYLQGTGRRAYRSDLDVRDRETLPGAGAVDALWEKVRAGFRKIVVRDHAYLHWKYERHPLCRYRFLAVHRGRELAAIGVYRKSHSHARLVDYVGPANDLELKLRLVAAFCDVARGDRLAACMTNDPELSLALRWHAFRATRTRPRLFVWNDAAGASVAEGWSVMAGDSDGEMLAAARESWEDHHGLSASRAGTALTSADSRHPGLPGRAPGVTIAGALLVRRLTDEEFARMGPEWSALLEASAADPLFMGWNWLYLWWRIWGSDRSRELYLLGAYDGSGALVGLAPLYRQEARWRRWLSIRQVQWMGTAWRTGGSVRTEYVDFIARREEHVQVARAFLEHLLADRRWDELILCDLDEASETCRLVRNDTPGRLKVREASAEPGTRIDTLGSYEDYLAELGKHTRLRVHNRRRLLAGLGTVELRYVDHDGVDEFFETLNALHRIRWGNACFDGMSLEFHREFARSMAHQGRLRASVLTLRDRPISALYNIRAGLCEYNIQAGFDDKLRKLSLGMLHLGYALEAAFEDPSVSSLDLLAGSGKSTFYKAHLGDRSTRFLTLQVIRGRRLFLAYQLNDRLRRRRAISPAS